MITSGLQKRPAAVAYHLFWNAVDWVFPPTCGGCNRTGERWCEHCQKSTRLLTENLCDRCGNPLPPDGHCLECDRQQPLFTALRSFCAYQGPARKAIHRLKYQRDLGIGEALAQAMSPWVASLQWPVDLITSVPLSPARLKQRGYNQASMIALPLAWEMGVRFNSGILRRARETSSQVGLSAAERIKNVNGAFYASGDLRGKTVLVIDDVITTGATMNSCASALLTAGASAVFGLSFARALLADHQVEPDPIF